MKFIGRFEELLGTERGIYFESTNTKVVLGLIHGCHEEVAGIKLKPKLLEITHSSAMTYDTVYKLIMIVFLGYLIYANIKSFRR